MEHTPILPPETRLESLPPGALIDPRFTADALNGLPVANFGMHRALQLLATLNSEQIGNAIEVLVALLDVAGGDPDVETGNDVEDDFALSATAITNSSGAGCAVGDPGDLSTTEWHTRGRHKQDPGVVRPDGLAHHEDDEEDDPSGQCDEDGVNTAFDVVQYTQGSNGAGCPISDPDLCLAGDDGVFYGPAVWADALGFLSKPNHRCIGMDEDMEKEQMHDDVPMIPTFSAEHNIFTDKRVPLGISNLQSSFCTGGREVRSADSGAILRNIDTREPGKPV